MNNRLRDKVVQLLEYWSYAVELTEEGIIGRYDAKMVIVNDIIEVYLYGVLDEEVEFSLRTLSEILSCQEH